MKTLRNDSAIIRAIKKNKKFLVVTHANPDADAICSALVMSLYLKEQGKTVYTINADQVPSWLKFLPKSQMIKKIQKKQKINYDVAIFVDCGDFERVGSVQHLIDRNKMIINIDHHVTNKSFGDLNLVMPNASSTAEVLYGLLKKIGYRLSRETAILFYSGIMTDTGSFRFENTTARTHHIISELLKFSFSVPDLYNRLYEGIPIGDLKDFMNVISDVQLLYKNQLACVELTQEDLKRFSGTFDLREKIFSFLRSFKGVEVIAIFTELRRKKTRVNFRSQNRFNVAKLAGHFNGGGHVRASGCTVDETMATVKKKIIAIVSKDL